MLLFNNFLFVQAEDGKAFYQMTLRYFDHLFEEERIGRAVCGSPAFPHQMKSIPVICAPAHIIVVLPIEAQLQKVRELGKIKTDMERDFIVIRWRGQQCLDKHY